MIGDILTLYRSRGLRGAPLKAALRRHAAILQANDPRDADELIARAGKAPERKPMRKGRPATREILDPERAAWLAHDKAAGLTRD